MFPAPKNPKTARNSITTLQKAPKLKIGNVTECITWGQTNIKTVILDQIWSNDLPLYSPSQARHFLCLHRRIKINFQRLIPQKPVFCRFFKISGGSFEEMAEPIWTSDIPLDRGHVGVYELDFVCSTFSFVSEIIDQICKIPL